MFAGKKALIVTKHGKQQVITPILEKELGIQCSVNSLIDTDQLGTFTGEIERKDDAITTLRNKCLLAANNLDHDLIIASEGSFGPHPEIFFVNADEELLMLIDRKNGYEIVARALSTETNFNRREIGNEDELIEFAKVALFPTHALILRDQKRQPSSTIKGISDWQTLLDSFRKAIDYSGIVQVETDMRAMYNPTRMKVIEKCTQNLVLTLQSQCPQCGTPGFEITKVTRGLPCGNCGTSTKGILSYISVCKICNCSTEEKYPHQKYVEDPMYCDRCNP